MVQTDLARALLGDQTQYTGMARSAVYRWFTDRVSGLPGGDHVAHGCIYMAQLSRAAGAAGAAVSGRSIAPRLREQSSELRTI